jgi:hypothetical protein
MIALLESLILATGTIFERFQATGKVLVAMDLKHALSAI